MLSTFTFSHVDLAAMAAGTVHVFSCGVLIPCILMMQLQCRAAHRPVQSSRPGGTIGDFFLCRRYAVLHFPTVAMMSFALFRTNRSAYKCNPADEIDLRRKKTTYHERNCPVAAASSSTGDLPYLQLPCNPLLELQNQGIALWS